MKKVNKITLFTDGTYASHIVDIPGFSSLVGLDNKTLRNSAKLLNVDLA